MPIVFFYGSWIRACTGSFGDVPKYFGLLKEVGYIAKWWVFTKITFFGSNFFRSVIRACAGSFANVYPGTSPLYIKVGQILGLSKNGSWALVDARNFFFDLLIKSMHRKFWICAKMQLHQKTTHKCWLYSKNVNCRFVPGGILGNLLMTLIDLVN